MRRYILKQTNKQTETTTTESKIKVLKEAKRKNKQTDTLLIEEQKWELCPEKLGKKVSKGKV